MTPSRFASLCHHPCRIAPDSPRSPRRTSSRTLESSQAMAPTISSVPSRLSSSTTITSHATSSRSSVPRTRLSSGPRFAASRHAGITSASFSRRPAGMAPPCDSLYDGTVAADDRLTNEPSNSIPKHSPRPLLALLLILLFSLVGFAVMGYHPGFEDDGIYLSAVKSDLNPALYPHDADFFRLQLQASIFDRWIAAFVRVTRIPVAWSELFWQLVSLYAILWAASRIAKRLFPEPRAHWAGVALLAAMFTLPVSGAAINLADQHLHPRNMATALILLAVERIMARKSLYAVPFLLLAILV